MWREIRPLASEQLSDFEREFDFKINPDFREFLLDHNNGAPAGVYIPTRTKKRRIHKFLDFADHSSSEGAWAVNLRLREEVGEKRIIFGVDALGNFLCLERNYRKQKVVLWNHLTDEFEPCLLEIPAFLREIF